MKKNIILTEEQIQHITQRIAYQIYETFVDEQEVVMAGIVKSGYVFAKKIAAAVEQISDIKVLLCEVEIDKTDPLKPITTTLSEEQYANKALILIDDVMNSGATLIYGVRHFLNVPIKKFKTAVLVDRNHKNYPVKADFKGISLSTSSLERIEVVLTPTEEYAYLC